MAGARLCGFLNVLKPTGMTSHDVVAAVRRAIPGHKIGHCGTLDPMATGVLPLAVGPATRLIQYLSTEKEYTATFRFGVQSDSDDICGRVIAHKGAAGLEEEEVRRAVGQFVGLIQQVPPAFSAVHIDGRRAYALARNAPDTTEVLRQIKPREVQVRWMELVEWRGATAAPPPPAPIAEGGESGEGGGGEDASRRGPLSPGPVAHLPEAVFHVGCSGGTYIRSLARDLGEALGCGGTLSAIHRVCSGAFHEQSSVPFHQVGLTTQLVSPVDVVLVDSRVEVTAPGRDAMFRQRGLLRVPPGGVVTTGALSLGNLVSVVKRQKQGEGRLVLLGVGRVRAFDSREIVIQRELLFDPSQQSLR